MTAFRKGDRVTAQGEMWIVTDPTPDDEGKIGVRVVGGKRTARVHEAGATLNAARRRR